MNLTLDCALFHALPATRRAGCGDRSLLQLRPGMQLAISSDMLVEGRIFADKVDPRALGQATSDLAACGATPLAHSWRPALPNIDNAWL
jgi:thiamine-monophosphate kinase